MGYPHFSVAAAKTIVNAAAYLATNRRRLLLEGRHRRGTYHNWSGDRTHRATWAQPRTEAEVAELVAEATQVRTVGSGHSFNTGLASDGLTLSLDRLAGLVDVDRDRAQATVWAGTRLRDLTPILLDHGLAIRSLASHDAQSVAGILSSDVHGTGRRPAHLSDQVVSLRLVDGSGEVHEVGPTDDLFRAAVGGVGAVGVITQVTVQCVEAFDLRQKTQVVRRRWAEDHLERLLAEHDHVSFYAYPFTDRLHLHTWDRTTDQRSRFGARRESFREAKAAVTAATFGDASAHWGVLRWTSTPSMVLQRSHELVLHSHQAFSRSQYHLHQELEVAVPRPRVWADLDATLELYRDRYRRQKLPFLLVEVRFSPASHDRSLLGPGAERDTAWLCLCANQSGAVDDHFADVEAWTRTNDARIHLGKWCEGLDHNDLARMHGPRFDRFQQARAKADPDGVFANPFTDRMLGPVGPKPADSPALRAADAVQP